MNKYNPDTLAGIFEILYSGDVEKQMKKEAYALLGKPTKKHQRNYHRNLRRLYRHGD